MPFERSCSSVVAQLSLGPLQWDLYRDVNRNLLAPAILRIHTYFDQQPDSPDTEDAENVERLRQIWLEIRLEKESIGGAGAFDGSCESSAKKRGQDGGRHALRKFGFEGLRNAAGSNGAVSRSISAIRGAPSFPQRRQRRGSEREALVHKQNAQS